MLEFDIVIVILLLLIHIIIILYHIFQLYLKDSLSNGMMMVSTIPGPQYRHYDARIWSI